MSEGKFKSFIFRLFSIFDYLIRISVIVFFFIIFIEKIRNNSDLTQEQVFYLQIFLSLPAVIYVFNIAWFLFKNWQSVKHGPFNTKYYPRNKHLVSFIAIILFYVTSLAGFVIFNSKPSSLLIQKLKPGALGIRAWYCEVNVELLNIEYLDLNNHWTKIPDSIVWSKNNWILKVMDHNKNQDRLEAVPNAYFNSEKKQITLSSCAAVFFPHDTIYRKSFDEFKVNAQITFTKLQGLRELYPGFQFIAFVDTLISGVNYPPKGKIDVSELLLQFNLSFFGYHHPWIPVLNWEPVVLSRDSKIKLQKHGGFLPPLQLNKSYNISATVYNDQVLFQGHAPKPDITTVTLFETRIEGSN
jgi:hypothetical protein